MLEIKSITKSFQEDFWKQKITVLNDLSFKLNEGEIIGFLGKNGSGKTTTINIILNILKPDKGYIRYGDSLGKSKKDIFKNIGYLPENPRFFENLTGRELLSFFGEIHNIKKADFSKIITEMAERINIGYALDKKIANYSKGMKQRIGLLSSILHRPRLLILDEPLSGLDPVGRSTFKEVIKEINKNGSTVFLTSHILEDLSELSSAFIHIENGFSKKGCVSKKEMNDEIYELKLVKRDAYKEFLPAEYFVSDDGYYTFNVNEKLKNKFLLEANVQSVDIVHLKKLPLDLKGLF